MNTVNQLRTDKGNTGSKVSAELSRTSSVPPRKPCAASSSPALGARADNAAAPGPRIST
jgi:hypothetical protein